MTEPRILEVLTDSNPLLRQVSREIGVPTDEVRSLAQDMIATMHAANGIGLAAIQVGAPLRMLVMKSQAGGDPLVMVDPVIEWSKKLRVEMQEGCLSLPGRRMMVTRPSDVEVSYTDLDGTRQKLALGGMPARVVQHEIDHLNGVLMPDHM